MTTLAAHDLTLTRSGKILCQQLNFSIVPGDYWAILGPNGCGKTTLLHTLSGHLKPAQGDIHLNNRPLTSLRTQYIAQHLGILFQDFNFPFPQSVTEYCLDARFPHHSMLAGHTRQNDIAIVEQALISLQLTQLAYKNIQQLSGGEQRRAAIAALLVQKPGIFMLDEPVNHLDIAHQIQTMQFFAQLSRALYGVIMTLHDINLAARYCNKILMLFPDGKTLQGTRDEMLTTTNLSQLYQHPIDVIQNGDQTYWLPADKIVER
jgi:iron complex transport system ATP-binding protein